MYSKLRFIYLLLFIFNSKQHESQELKTMGWEVLCKLQPNNFLCSNSTVEHRFFYDIALDGCSTFVWRGCDLSLNRFSTLSLCSTHCYHTKAITDLELNALSWNVSCRLQYDFGRCSDYLPMFYYDVSTRKCKSFSYSGCGGNRNKFPTYRECMGTCEFVFPVQLQFYTLHRDNN